MTVHTPPSWLQNGSHPAENDRLTTQALWATTGIISPTSLAVTANSPVGMSVLVAAGWAAIVGTIQPNMGTYVAFNDGTVFLPITAANSTNARIDLVCMTVNDSYYVAGSDDVILQVVAGTPAGSPVAPATPANSIALAEVYVGAGVLSINSGNITDKRVSVTTNLPIGDITSVTAGTGLTGGGTSGAVTLSIGSSVATLTGVQALTNKDLTDATNTFPTTLARTNLTINAQSGTSYSAQTSDNGKLVTLTNAGAIAVSIPSGTASQGAQINFAQMGTGQVTITGGSGVTVVSTGATANSPKARAQYSTVTAICTATDTWLVVGDIA